MKNVFVLSKKNIALLGMGTVGRAVYEEIKSNVSSVLVKDITKKRNIHFSEKIITNDFEEIIQDNNIDIVIELIGGETPAYNYIKRSIKSNKNVITANKEVMGKYGEELLDLAEKNNVFLLYEASVAGGIPIISPLVSDLSANDFSSIRGIINGTTNYILTKMANEKLELAEVLKEAQDLGYAEADPTSDIDGFDAQYKISILSRIAFNTNVSIDQIYVEGISNIKSTDFAYASELGYTVKLLATASINNDNNLLVKVHPALIPNHVPMSSVNGVLNAVEIKGDLVGTLWFQGAGAGAKATASSVLSDLIKIQNSEKKINVNRKNTYKITSMDSHFCQYYLRLNVSDKPGVLASIAMEFGGKNISISSVLQKDLHDDGSADLVIMTYPSLERDMQSSIKQINNLDTVFNIESMIRVESYN
ncbi:MAG: homoserine dehydrogenase [SAR202 cluster bacterium]|nr:homoserine dehydrogenase [SAR202 cluster bacterium]|tara:strand:+ start:5325 stop:6584 length:1260 start_codon:yes stop_codon:yes gene_type:complete